MSAPAKSAAKARGAARTAQVAVKVHGAMEIRSEERRVGKECPV